MGLIRCFTAYGDAAHSPAAMGMDILHAYWRMDYVTADADPVHGHASPFLQLPMLGDDRKALIVYRGKHHYIVLNRYPYNPGHVLIVPYREVAELELLDADERAELMDLFILAQQKIRKAMNPAGFNMGFNLGKVSGAGIPCHLHGHLVPRWVGDSNFLTVLGETRALPQALDKTWEILTAAFADD